MSANGHEDEGSGEDAVRDWLGARWEELLGKVTRALIDDSAVTTAVSRAFEARSKATQAQESAMGFLNIPTAGDVERLTRRLRSIAQRLDAIENAVTRLEDGVRDQAQPALHRVEAIEAQLASAMQQLSELHAVPTSVSPDQKRLPVDEGTAGPKRRKGKRPKRDG
jgi:hypothetical protein